MLESASFFVWRSHSHRRDECIAKFNEECLDIFLMDCLVMINDCLIFFCIVIGCEVAHTDIRNLKPGYP